jgi:hypothetical protein
MIDLVTLDEYKDAMGISSPNDDIKLTALITSVSALVKTYCGRLFVDYVLTDKIEEFSISGGAYFVQLDESPVISVTSVEERSSYGADYETLDTAAQQYYLDPNTDSIYRTNGTSGYQNFCRGPGAVKVTYKAGFTDIPEDLKLVVQDLITYYHKHEYKGYQMMKGAAQSTPGSTSQYKNVSFPDHIKRVLDLYKNF